MYAYTFSYARVWVYICNRVGAFCLFVLTNLSTTCARVSQVFLNTCMRVCGGIGSGVCFSLFVVSACYWRGRLCFGRGRDRCFVLRPWLISLTVMLLKFSPFEPDLLKKRIFFECTALGLNSIIDVPASSLPTIFFVNRIHGADLLPWQRAI